MASFRHKIVDKKISHWTFEDGIKDGDFAAIYPEMKRVFATGEITGLCTVVKVKEPTDDDVLQLWFNVGEAAQEGGIAKWGVVIEPLDLMPKMTFERMVSGAGKPRDYEIEYGAAEEEILAWLKA